MGGKGFCVGFEAAGELNWAAVGNIIRCGWYYYKKRVIFVGLLIGGCCAGNVFCICGCD